MIGRFDDSDHDEWATCRDWAIALGLAALAATLLLCCIGCAVLQGIS